MAESRTLADGKTMTYHGPIDLKNLLKHIDEFFKQRGYDKQELKNHEQVTGDEREIVMEIMPFRKISDYEKIEIRLFMIFKHLKEADVDFQGTIKKVFVGDAVISMDCYLVTDYENTMQMKPGLMVFRTLVDKFVHKHYISEAEAWAKKDATDVEREIKAWLAMQKM